jgi:hypothetical protein
MTKDEATLYFLQHRKGGYIAEGPFIDGESAQKARSVHDFTNKNYDIVFAVLPVEVWEYNDND